MDKMKAPWKTLSLRKSIILYILIFVILALILSWGTFAICNQAIVLIRESYPPMGEKYYLTNEKGERLGEGTYIGTAPIEMTKKDEQWISFLEILPTITTPVYSAACIMAAAFLFYKNKLKKPLGELKNASEKITNNDLSFSIEYESTDELGQLCNSFEIMRSALARNFSEMWRQVEERKQLNAAFAHDLRTPLTVLKGYNEMLQMNSDTETCKTAKTMGRHIVRIEQYIDSMSSMCRLEDTQPVYEETTLSTLVSALANSSKVICDKAKRNLVIQGKTHSHALSVDPAFITQVSNNLIANAARYTVSSVILCIEETNGGLLLSVIDDGCGFSEDNLRKATTPYFTETENHSEHFGLGLYICKVLCEHHGGYLLIENIDSGAKVSAFFKTSGL